MAQIAVSKMVDANDLRFHPTPCCLDTEDSDRVGRSIWLRLGIASWRLSLRSPEPRERRQAPMGNGGRREAVGGTREEADFVSHCRRRHAPWLTGRRPPSRPEPRSRRSIRSRTAFPSIEDELSCLAVAASEPRCASLPAPRTFGLT